MEREYVFYYITGDDERICDKARGTSKGGARVGMEWV